MALTHNTTVSNKADTILGTGDAMKLVETTTEYSNNDFTSGSAVAISGSNNSIVFFGLLCADSDMFKVEFQNSSHTVLYTFYATNRTMMDLSLAGSATAGSDNRFLNVTRIGDGTAKIKVVLLYNT